jgi:hypothetical protein
MLCGLSGIPHALLIIAADDGIMPQTREHLAILQLAGIPGSAWSSANVRSGGFHPQQAQAVSAIRCCRTALAGCTAVSCFQPQGLQA